MGSGEWRRDAAPIQAFIETAALAAVMDGDQDRVLTLLREMSGPERRELEQYAERLADYARRWCNICGQPLLPGEPVTYNGARANAMMHAGDCPEVPGE